MKKKIIAALLHTLLETYGNEKIYHPDGTTFKVDELADKYLRVKPPTGRALEIEGYESSFDSLACEFMSELQTPEINEAYVVLRDKLHNGIKRKWPTTRFGNF